ncbi:MAG: 2-C-methyl-D-erythritol 4-phosphate cytidylyltransferase [Limisphaerales bacterium]
MTCAIIVAAGKGTRMGINQDKLFLEVAGRPLVAHTWQRFDESPEIQHVVMVVRDGNQQMFSEMAAQYGFQKPFTLVAGGKERQDSVWNGLEALPAQTEVVAIQDAARPCTSAELIRACIEAAEDCGAAVAAMPVTDTIKASEDGEFISRHLDRSRLWSVQTPQTFRVGVIKRALAEVQKQKVQVTDDTAACELIEQPVKLVHVSAPNPKLTTKADIAYIESILSVRG